jgi:hypothetical protein
MSHYGVVKIPVEFNESSSVAPAGYGNCNTQSSRVTGCIDYIDTHYRVLAAHALRSEADRVDAVLEEAFHLSGFLILIV